MTCGGSRSLSRGGCPLWLSLLVSLLNVYFTSMGAFWGSSWQYSWLLSGCGLRPWSIFGWCTRLWVASLEYLGMMHTVRVWVVIDFLGWRAPCVCMQPFDPESFLLFGQCTFIALVDVFFRLLYTKRRYKLPFPCNFFARHPYGGVRWTLKARFVLHQQCGHCWLGLRSLVVLRGAECCVRAKKKPFYAMHGRRSSTSWPSRQ